MFGGNDAFSFDVLSLQCLQDFHVEMNSKLLDVLTEAQEIFARDRTNEVSPRRTCSVRSTALADYAARSLKSCKEGATRELSIKSEERNPNGRECSEPGGWSAV